MKKFIIGLVGFVVAFTVFAADIDVTPGGSSSIGPGFAGINARRTYVVQQTVDFSVYPLASTGVVKVAYLPSNTLMSAASLQFINTTAATNGINATATISLGDRGTAADWVAAITACSNSIGSSAAVLTAGIATNGAVVALTTTPSNAFGQFYPAPTNICIFAGTAGVTCGVAKVSIVVEDLH